MDANLIAITQACLRGAEDGTKTFPEIVAALIEAGFEGYAVDFRRATAIYYRPDGDSVELEAHRIETPVAARFDAEPIQAAIRQAQALSPGSVLTALMIRHLLDEEHVAALDFGRGDDGYKAAWTGQVRPRIGVLLCPLWHPAGIAALARHAAGRLTAKERAWTHS